MKRILITALIALGAFTTHAQDTNCTDLYVIINGQSCRVCFTGGPPYNLYYQCPEMVTAGIQMEKLPPFCTAIRTMDSLYYDKIWTPDPGDNRQEYRLCYQPMPGGGVQVISLWRPKGSAEPGRAQTDLPLPFIFCQQTKP